MNVECRSCGVYEGLPHHQEDEDIYLIKYSDSVYLRDIIKKLVL